MEHIRVETVPIEGQKPGTSGLRMKTEVFMGPHYLENFVQAIWNAIGGIKGKTLILGGDGRVEARDARDGRLVWEAPVEGRAHGLAVARGRLLVATDLGELTAFEASGEPLVVRHPEPGEAEGPGAEMALTGASAPMTRAGRARSAASRRSRSSRVRHS